jgi:hypothetical protein
MNAKPRRTGSMPGVSINLVQEAMIRSRSGLPRQSSHSFAPAPSANRSLRDRVCMTAAMLVLEPIFEADLPPEQYAYPSRAKRPTGGGRGGSSVVSRPPGSRGCRPHGLLRKHPHRELLKSVARRIVDRRVLHLIKMWLESPVEEIDFIDTAPDNPRRPGVGTLLFHSGGLVVESG